MVTFAGRVYFLPDAVKLCREVSNSAGQLVEEPERQKSIAHLLDDILDFLFGSRKFFLTEAK